MDGGANTANFVVRRYDGSAWNFTTTGTLTATSAAATGITSFNTDFAVGEAAPINNAPTLAALGNLTLNEDDGAQTVNLSGIGMGGGDTGQTLTVTATSSSTAIIPNPTVSYTSANTTGSISFTPVPSAFGTVTITVKVQDDGGSGLGSVNAVTNTFTVTVNAVNDAPSFTVNGLTAGTAAGTTWTARESIRAWSAVASSADGTKLVAADNAPGQIYTSTDSGVTWTARESNLNWQSVASSGDGTKLAAVVGGGQIYTSTDSGATWTAQASGNLRLAVHRLVRRTGRSSWRRWFKTARFTPRPTWGRPGRRKPQVAAAWRCHGDLVGGRERSWRRWSNGGQIYTSTDSGVNWTARESSRNWQSVASSSDGSSSWRRRMAASYTPRRIRG